MLAKQSKSVDSLPTDMSDNTDESDGEEEVSPHPRRRRRRSRPATSRSAPSPAPPSGALLNYTAWRESREPAARQVLERTCALNVDDLFTLLFTNSKFFYDFQVGGMSWISYK
jgi:hypothetical protein